VAPAGVYGKDHLEQTTHVTRQPTANSCSFPKQAIFLMENRGFRLQENFNSPVTADRAWGRAVSATDRIEVEIHP
jgi:hypothetical protein